MAIQPVNISNMVINPPFASGGLVASQIQANSMHIDKMYPLSFIKKILQEAREQAHADEDTDAVESDDAYESGHSAGYTAGFLDGIDAALEAIEKR